MTDRTAVVVVADIGGSPDAGGADALARRLEDAEGYRLVAESSDRFLVEDDSAMASDHNRYPREARRLALARETDRGEVDIFECQWADLTRFPGALRSLVAAVFARFLELPRIGQAAVRGGTAIGRYSLPPVMMTPAESPAGLRSRLAAAGFLGLLAWTIAVPIMVVSVASFGLAALFVLALELRSLPAGLMGNVFALAGAGLLVYAGGLAMAQRYGRSGRVHAVPVTVLVMGTLAATAITRGVSRGSARLDLALGDTLIVSLAYLLRSLWLIALGGGLLVAVFAAMWILRVARVDREAASDARRAGVTAVLSGVIGPLGCALVLTMASAVILVVSQPLTGSTEFTAAARSGGVPSASQTDAVFDALGATVPRPPSTPEQLSTPNELPWCMSGSGDWSPSARDCVVTGVPGSVGPDGLSERVLTADEWGRRLFEQTLAPLVPVAIGVAVVGFVGALLLFASVLQTDVRGRREPPSSPTHRARRVTVVLGLLERGLAPIAFVVFPIAAYQAASTWIDLPGGLGGGGVQAASMVVAVLGVGVTVTFLLVRLSRAVGRVAGQDAWWASEASGGRVGRALRALVNQPYDLAVFMREASSARGAEPVRSPRARMLARYAALLQHVVSQGEGALYDRVILVGHGQGSVLTVTMLHEPPPVLPGDVRLVTVGSPLRQLYRQRLPRQFGWLDELSSDPWRYLSPESHLTEWVNIAAPGDFLGRTVFASPPVPWIPGTVVLPSQEGGPRLVELTVDGGSQRAWWTRPALSQTLHRMITDQKAPTT